VQELVREREARALVMGKRVMKEWVVVGLPTLKASAYDPRFGCQTTQGQSVSFARLHSMIS
jgi:hypothetical protein